MKTKTEKAGQAWQQAVQTYKQALQTWQLLEIKWGDKKRGGRK